MAAFSLGARDNSGDSVSQPNPILRYTFQITMPSGYISGILLVNETEENIRGSMINEFGVSAIDFSYSKKNQKIRLLNVVSFLNKWYIKQVLKNDLRFCLHVLFNTPYKKKHNYEVVSSTDSISIINPKRHLTYSFSSLPIKSTQDDTQK